MRRKREHNLPTPLRNPQDFADDAVAVDRIAEALEEGALVVLGDFIVTRLVTEWTTTLTFTSITTGNTYTRRINTDGPQHAAEQVFDWWETDAWEV